MNLKVFLFTAMVAITAVIVDGYSCDASAEVAVPPLTGRVVDLTGTLPNDAIASLSQTLRDFEVRKGSQIAVLLVPTTKPETIEQYSLRVANGWKIGRSKINDGVVMVVAMGDHTLRIEVGYGLEGALTNVTAKRIIDENIVPRFRAGDFAGGISAGIKRIISVIENEQLPPPTAPLSAETPVPVDAALSSILASATVKKTLADLKADDEAAFGEQKRITEIASPPYKEKVRSEYFLKRMQELGLKDAAIDSEGNVIATRKGTGNGHPKLVVAAHLDTVFPEGTDVTVREKDGIVVAPGIGDDARGLAVLLSLIKAMNANNVATVGDIMFVGDVGEEELGNLRGMKALFRDHADIDGFISIDGLDIDRIVNQGTGSHRYEMTFKGPGGHSFQEFGLPSAIHAMGRAIAKIADLRTPSDPKTTFTVGTVSGGTSVNAIASEARMTVDMRSNSTEELLKLEAQLLDQVKQAVVEENARWKTDKLTVAIKLIGDRPAGFVAANSPIVVAAERTVAAVANGRKVTLAGSSTDSNQPMSLGIPAVTIGGGGEGGNWHSVNEWYKPVDGYLGPQRALLAILLLEGLDGVAKPTLPVREPAK